MSFASAWPLDGSAAAGWDLREAATAKQSKMAIATMRSLADNPMFGGPEGFAKMLADLDSRITLTKQPPSHNSSPLAMFVDSKPQAMYSSQSAAAAAAPAQRAGTSNAQPAAAASSPPPGVSSKRARHSSPAAAVPAAGAAGAGAAARSALFHSTLANACCDIKRFSSVPPEAYVMHIDGDLICYGYSTDYRGREPGFDGAVLRYQPAPNSSSSSSSGRQAQSASWERQPKPDWGLMAGRVNGGNGKGTLQHGLFSHVQRVCADAGNALIWCAGDSGRRIKAFAVPKELAAPKNTDATCNQGEGNGMMLQYTLSNEADCAGLHVIGTKVFSVSGDGALRSWDVSVLPPQHHARNCHHAYCESAEDSEEGSDGEGPIFVDDLDMRDMDWVELECSKGVPPTMTQQLQLPTTPFGKGMLGQSCLLPGTSTTMAASWQDVSPCKDVTTVLTFDLETQKPENLFFGHIFEVTDIAAAPAAWAGSENLFATCAKSGDVKLWDMRRSGGAAAVTMVTGNPTPMEAVTLASSSSSGGGGSGGAGSSSGSQLGAGMLCFAGGSCESVWAWDLRASSAQALYQLSTGNQAVTSLAWHEGSSSLIAGCEATYEWEQCKPCEPEDMPPGYVEPGEEEAFWDEEEYRWPPGVKHEPKDFRKFYHVGRSCALAYTFSDAAVQTMPEYDYY